MVKKVDADSFANASRRNGSSLNQFLDKLEHVRNGAQFDIMAQLENDESLEVTSRQGNDVRSIRASRRTIKVYSIGFTHHTAKTFFETLKQAGVRRLVDIRLNNWSQFAGYTKKTDFPYLLEKICKAEYKHELLLAPTRELLDAYKKNRIDWNEYEKRFTKLMIERKVEEVFSPKMFSVPTALLCYEPNAECCHRRLVLEYLQEKWGCLKVTHL